MQLNTPMNSSSADGSRVVVVSGARVPPMRSDDDGYATGDILERDSLPRGHPWSFRIADRAVEKTCRWSLFTSGEAVVGGLLALTEEARKIGATPRWLGYVGVTDVDAAAEQVRRLGEAVHIPPTEIPSISCFSVVSDPQMATFVLFKLLERPQEVPGEVGRPGSVGWHELISSDPEKAFAFYCELLAGKKGRPPSTQ
jgi:predicted enzyme related to lactoylglutathione lyase